MAGLVLYLVGYAVLIAGLALAADLLGVPRPWIVAGVVILLGSGIMAASQRVGGRRDEK
ncbi:hypothetical protein [Truepera radiovictrix]|uniref:Uncharacterized protein n=1 Tax=Truepera radiovictrix (strain DSM 17093 / CIP 108686 / LMG 22925 / RQ-24) TaxID=649638 RepID=D7CSD3_TRURR|nr:hypothetical protein [Truepera radiovictrix]ADI13665.1 hypothetical protein Trad_0528 [Truepera radiovictrix DSM 17093]WMT57773.1 hypothetical protein RCV51_02215 [Truepera radiovictrix]